MTTATQNNLASANESEFELTVTQLPDEQRICFWPQHFGTIPQWTTLEPHIFAWMGRFCADYSGGIWSFYTLSNGGAFMAPDADSDDKWHLFNSMNGNGADMSADAAGITLADAINFLVEKYELVRIDRRGFSWQEQTPYLTIIDIMRARRDLGLLNRN